jgi:hypothetical protein
VSTRGGIKALPDVMKRRIQIKMILPIDHNKQAAYDLLIKAMHVKTESLFNLMAESAYRLDNTINLEHARIVWADNWMIQKEKERKT